MRTEVLFFAPFKHALVNVENLEVFELLYTPHLFPLCDAFTSKKEYSTGILEWSQTECMFAKRFLKS